MITKALLFPSSSYLRTRWWHRLAKVIFWAWFLVVLAWLINAVLLDPYSSCVTFNVRFQMATDAVSTLKCGDNAFDHLLSRISVGGVAFFAVLTYIGLVLPGLAYRLGLYIAKGSSWKDAAGAA